MTIKIKNIIYASLLFTGVLATSCNDFLDVNTDPVRVNEDQVTLAAMLPTIIEATSQTQYNYAFTLSQITQKILLRRLRTR